MLLLCSILLLSPALAAPQGGELPSRRTGGQKGGSKLDLPIQQPATPGSAAAAADSEAEAPYQSEFWGQTKDRAELVFVALEVADQKKSLSKRQLRQALNQLEGMGLRTRITALKALESPHIPSVILAARLLRAIGDMEQDDAKTLVEIASGVGQPEAAGECLDAALIIQGKLPISTVVLVSHPHRPIRTLAESRLKKNPDPAFVPGYLRALQYGRDPDVRVRCARLLAGYPEVPAARDGLRQALGDKSVTVAFACSEALARQVDAEQISFLTEQILASQPSPELGYLIFSLLRLQENSGDLLVNQELARRFRQLLSDDDLFLSGVAASGLAEYIFRSDTEEDIDALQRSLPMVLVRSIGGMELYPQYANFSPMAEQSLRRISGQDFGNRNRRAWVDWYAVNKTGFRLVRGQLEVTAKDLDRLQVSWFSDQHGSQRLSGLNGNLIEADGSTRVLGAQGMQRLADLLHSSVILDSNVLPGTYGQIEDPVVSGVEVQIGGRRKPIRFRGPAGAEWLPGLLQDLDRLYSEQGWQVLASGSGRADYLRNSVPEWDASTPEARTALLVKFQKGRLQELPLPALKDWCEHLLQVEGLAEFWNEEAAYLALDRLKTLPNNPPMASLLMRVALLDQNPAMTAPMVEIASKFDQPMRSDMLVLGMRTIGPGAGAICLKDERLPVQVAAARALGDGGPEAIPALLSAIAESDPLVLRVALHSLGEIGSPVVLEQVLGWASKGKPREIRKEALLTLGALGDPRGVPALLAAAESQDFGTRLAAISALRKVPGPEAGAAFADILPLYLGTTLEASFHHSLESRGAGLARATYMRYFDDPQPAIMRRSVILAGRLGEPTSVSHLMAILSNAPHDQEILEALAHSTCVDFRTMPDPAGVYGIWWRDHSREDPALWLVDGLKGRGFDLAEHFVDGSGASLETIVGDLLEVLVNGPGHLRAAVALYLTELTTLDSPTITPELPKAVVVKMAKPWQAWLDHGVRRSNG
jgi:HEAT repeat protein